MFENTSNFDFDDDFLDSSFSSVITSTQQRDGSQAPVSAPNQKAVNKSSTAVLTLQEDEPLKKKPKQYEKETNLRYPSCESVHENNTFNSSPKVVTRRFPGPAGLMDNSDVFAPCSTAKNDSQIDSFFLCSQRTMSTFEDGPWTQMTKDFCILYDNSTIYERFNIAWIKKQSNSKLFKAPFLAAVIQSYEITNGQVPTVNVTLQDPTGCIQATILHSLYKEKLDYLTTGSVLVLKSFGVLCVQNSYCLTITENNLVRIYSIQTKKIDRDKKTSVEIIEVQKVNINEMLKNHNECLEVAKTSCGSKVNKISNIRTKSDEVTTNSLCNIFSTTSDKRLLNSPSHGSNIVNTLKSPSGCCIRDNVTEKTSTSNSAKTFNFKKPAGSKNDNISFSQVSVKTDKSEHTEIWKNLFEDIDAESLFSDF